MNSAVIKAFSWEDSTVSEPVCEQFCEALLSAGYQGDLHRDEAGKLLAATDNSVYQVTPALVLAPLNGMDLDIIGRVAASPAFERLALTARGGGTGTNGQALTNAIVIDTSRHMTRVLAFNAEARTVRVEPGVVLAQLNAYLAEHGLTFPAQISTASRATIGGMVSTDACGKGSRIYGKTGDYVESLNLILARGGTISARTYTAEELDAAAHAGDAGMQLAQQLRALVSPVRESVEAVFPRISRSLTGYDIQRAFPADGAVHLQRLIAGSEGTLAIIRDITLRVVPIPTVKKLVVVRYPSLDEALSDCQRILTHGPSAIETLDEKLYALARNDATWTQVRHAMEGDTPPEHPLVTNFVEFLGDSESEVDARITGFVESLREVDQIQGHYVANASQEQKQLWGVRSRGVGLLARADGPRKPIAFVEDTVVPPEHLPAYIKAFRAILDRHGVDYGMFGHVDAGCLHVRPALDMTQESDARLLRTITEEVVALVKQYGGLLWGEHGKGYRGEFTRDFFGNDLYPVLGEIKRLFDPNNRMNPGKIVTPRPDIAAVAAIDAVPFRGTIDGEVPASIRQQWTKAFECNGNGVCFDWDTSVPICPSYKVTRDRVQSPKGRAALLREWLRVKQANDRDRLQIVEQQLMQSMQGCLGCNACASQCPVHVSIPELRSRFLETYYRTHGWPLRERLLGNMERVLSVTRRLPWLFNPLLGARPVRRLAERRLGVIDSPLLSQPSFEQRIAKGYRQPRRSRGSVALLLDPYTSSFDAAVPEAAVALLRALNFEVSTIAAIPSGKAAHVHGMREKAAQQSQAVLRTVASLARRQVPVIALEPSVALFLRQDCGHAELGDAAGKILLLNEWLAGLGLDTGVPTIAGDEQTYGLLAHCTEITAIPTTGESWRDLFRSFGLLLQPEPVGCCGMAGTYGHLVENQERSKKLYAMSWQRHVAHYGERLLATGFSCRCQVGRLGGFRPRHPVEVLAQRALGLSQDASSSSA